VSRVIASSHKKERVFVTLNGYRWDDFKPYVYVSENYGATWKDISSNLPTSSVNVIKEDPVNENLLYLGTDNGAYVSFNRGESWEVFSKELPNVAVHDLVIQPEAKHLVLGTHGRSLYVADIALLQKLSSNTMNEMVLDEIDSLNFSPRWGSKFSTWGEVYEPKTKIQFYSPQSGKTTITIKTEEEKELQTLTTDAIKGVNKVDYDLSIPEKASKLLAKEDAKVKQSENGKYYLQKGKYKVTVSVNGKSLTSEFEVK
jgi:hypothetical protein